MSDAAGHPLAARQTKEESSEKWNTGQDMDGSSASGGIAGCGSPAGENAPMQLYVGNTDILPGGTWTSEDGITWTRNDSAEDHCVR